MNAARPMTVGFDVSPLAWPAGGIGRYTYELLDALGASGPDPTIVPVGHRRLADDALPPSLGDVASVSGPRSPSRAAWTFGLLPLWLRRSRLDVFHATGNYAPLGSAVPTVVTVHDMSVFECPDTHPWGRVARARAMLGRAARDAAAIITPTEAARDDAQRWLAVAPERIHVVPEAPAARFRPVEEHEATSTAARHGLRPGFFLALGAVEPRKNLVRVVDAVARLDAAGDPVRLAIVGRLAWKHERVMRHVERVARPGLVRYLGPLPDADLRALMGAAAALVYPSLHEGFGLPIVEAMACGLPVITSRGGATAEVAGGAALLVDPRDPGSIADAMAAVGQPSVRARLRASGLRRAADFSWSRTAAETLAVYRSVAPVAEGRAS